MAVAVARESIQAQETEQSEHFTESRLTLVPQQQPSIYTEERFASIVVREAAHLTGAEGKTAAIQHLGRVTFLREQLGNYEAARDLPEDRQTPYQQIIATTEQLRLHTSILEKAGVEITADLL